MQIRFMHSLLIWQVRPTSSAAELLVVLLLWNAWHLSSWEASRVHPVGMPFQWQLEASTSVGHW